MHLETLSARCLGDAQFRLQSKDVAARALPRPAPIGAVKLNAIFISIVFHFREKKPSHVLAALLR